jgi:outer membrane protein assembly factor BamB
MFRGNLVAGAFILVVLSVSALVSLNFGGANLGVFAASTNSVTASALWSFTAPNITGYTASPSWSVRAAGDRIYAVVSENYVVPGENNPLMPYGRMKNILYAFTNNGVSLWNFTETYLRTPTVVDKTVYVPGRNSPSGGLNEIFALDADTGAQKWLFYAPGDLEWFTLDGNVMYVGVAHIPVGSTYYMYAVNASSGLQLWRQTFAWGDDYPEDVIVHNGVIYFAHSHIPGPEGPIGQDEYYALNGTDGSTIWKVQLNGGTTGPSAFIGGLICFSTHDAVCALNATNGATVWSYPPEQGYFFSTTFGSNGNIVYAVGIRVYENLFDAYKVPPNIYAINALDGSKLWNYSTTGTQITAIGGLYNLDIIDGTFYNIMDVSSIWAFNAATGQQLWSYSHIARPYAIDSGVVYCYEDNNLEALDASNGRDLWNCTTPARFITAANRIEYLQLGWTFYALNINANSSFMSNSEVSPSQNPSPATANPSAASPTPTPITPEFPGIAIVFLLVSMLFVAVVLGYRKSAKARLVLT